MKRTLLTMAVLVLISLSACSQANKKTEEPQMNKVLVAYFSASGTTKVAAQQLAQVAKADLHEIKPARTYTYADLDWTDKKSRSTLEMKDSTARPAVASKVENMDQYTTIYVGFPIWWYTAPRIVNTFLEQYDLKGKTIIPFATSGGSDMGKSGEDLKNASAPAANWILPGKVLNGNPPVDSLKVWVETLFAGQEAK